MRNIDTQDTTVINCTLRARNAERRRALGHVDREREGFMCFETKMTLWNDLVFSVTVLLNIFSLWLYHHPTRFFEQSASLGDPL
jgi:hypothetical protein